MPFQNNQKEKFKLDIFDKSIAGVGTVLSLATISPIPLSVAAAVFLVKIGFQKMKRIEKSTLKDFQRNFFDENNIGSFPNRPQILEGRSWTDVNEIYDLPKPTDSDLILDRFKFCKSEHNEINLLLSRYVNGVVGKTIAINRVLTTLSTLIIGKMGSGKTVTLEDWLIQNRQDFILPSAFGGEFKIWNREFVLDYKMTLWAKFGRPEKDHLFNTFDARSSAWDIWKELNYHPTVITAFLNGIVEKRAGGGDGKSKFFTGTAAMTLEEMAMRTHLENRNETIGNKYDIFLTKLEKWIEKESQPNGNESLAKTLALCLNPIKLLSYNAHVAKKSFTLEEDFFRKKDVSLYVGNTEKYRVEIEPIVAGITDAVQLILLSKPENADRKAGEEEDLTLFLLEEAKRINLLNLSPLLTGGRGRGACVVMLIQYVDWQKHDEVNLLFSSIEVFMIFQVGAVESKKLSEQLGMVTYIEENLSTSTSHSSSAQGGSSSTSTSHSRAEKKEPFVSQDIINSIPPHHHITLIPSRKLFYLGQSNYTKIEESKKVDDEIDVNDLGMFKFFKTEWKIINGKVFKHLPYAYSKLDLLDIYKTFIIETSKGYSSEEKRNEDMDFFKNTFEFPSSINLDVLFQNLYPSHGKFLTIEQIEALKELEKVDNQIQARLQNN